MIAFLHTRWKESVIHPQSYAHTLSPWRCSIVSWWAIMNWNPHNTWPGSLWHFKFMNLIWFLLLITWALCILPSFLSMETGWREPYSSLTSYERDADQNKEAMGNFPLCFLTVVPIKLSLHGDTSAPLCHLCVPPCFPFNYQKGELYWENNDKVTTTNFRNGRQTGREEANLNKEKR